MVLAKQNGGTTERSFAARAEVISWRCFNSKKFVFCCFCPEGFSGIRGGRFGNKRSKGFRQAVDLGPAAKSIFRKRRAPPFCRFRTLKSVCGPREQTAAEDAFSFKVNRDQFPKKTTRGLWNFGAFSSLRWHSTKFEE